MSQGGRNHWHWGWDVERLVTDPVAHRVSLSLQIVDALQSPLGQPQMPTHSQLLPGRLGTNGLFFTSQPVCLQSKMY